MGHNLRMVKLPDSLLVDAGLVPLLLARGAVLIDVRTATEYNAGHADGAVHCPMSVLGEAPALYGDRLVITVCASGYRSSKAVLELQALGMAAVCVRGGLNAWLGSGGVVLNRRGLRGRVV
jgi:rhodanese-related sulfurtransferase